MSLGRMIPDLKSQIENLSYSSSLELNQPTGLFHFTRFGESRGPNTLVTPIPMERVSPA